MRSGTTWTISTGVARQAVVVAEGQWSLRSEAGAPRWSLFWGAAVGVRRRSASRCFGPSGSAASSARKARAGIALAQVRGARGSAQAQSQVVWLGEAGIGHAGPCRRALAHGSGLHRGCGRAHHPPRMCKASDQRPVVRSGGLGRCLAGLAGLLRPNKLVNRTRCGSADRAGISFFARSALPQRAGYRHR